MGSVALHFSSENACGANRMLFPARFCSQELEERGHQVSVTYSVQEGFDWFVFHGLPGGDTVLKLMKLKNKGTNIAWSLDDDWTTIPDWNPAKPSEDGLAQFGIMKGISDALICSTEHLASTFLNTSHNSSTTFVTPNLLDLGTFPKPDGEDLGFGEYAYNLSLPIRCIWSGGDTHKGDVEILIPVIERLLKRHGPEVVSFGFIGMAPPPKLLRDWLGKGVMWLPPMPFAQYRKNVNITQPHVWLAPQASIPFNQSKSSLRILEGWGLNAAVCASNWGEYSCIRNDVDGLLCETEDDWYRSLNRLITDHEYRMQMAMDGRQRVRAQYDWNKRECRLPWLKMFGALLNDSITE